MAKCWCCWTGSPGWGSGTRGEPYSFVGSDPRRGPKVPGTAGLWGMRGVWEGEIKQSVKRRKGLELLQVRGSQGWRNHTDEQMGFLEIPRKTCSLFPTRWHSSPAKATLSHPSHVSLCLRLQYTHLPPNYLGASKKTGGGSGSLQGEELTTRVCKVGWRN